MNFVREAAALIESDEDREVAIQILEKAITVDPTNPYAFFMLGRAFSRERQYESAAAAYSLSVIHFKNRANWLLESYLQLGLAYEKTSQKDKGAECYKRALELDPQNRVAKKALKRL